MTQSKKTKRERKPVQEESSARETLGAFLRAQRRLAGLTLRQLAEITSVSNAYLSQIERGLHKPSVDVLRSVARGLNVSVETILDQVGLFEDPDSDAVKTGSRILPDTEAAIRTDARLEDAQREALLVIYRSYVAANEKPKH
jgi:transcriptional regulator with XRE-family HTH domain